jgi:hypothetical protein
MSRRRDWQRRDAFGGGNEPSLEEITDSIYGKPAAGLDTGRVVARPIALEKISADLRQPRRAIPASLRGGWNGTGADLLTILDEWAMLTAGVGIPRDIGRRIVNGDDVNMEGVELDALGQGYIDLARLAGSIKRDGLINPISVVEAGTHYRIEAGERRWLAYHLLMLVDGDEWDKIPAIVGDGSSSVWRQAAENTARRQLNAIGMARQLALLIMEARGWDEYLPYEECKSDRAFYAQVADGNEHRVPRGYGERISNTMGIGAAQLRQYRRLLALTDSALVNDALWVAADEDDSAEGFLRELAGLPVGILEGVVKRREWGMDDMRNILAHHKRTVGARADITPPLAPPRDGRGTLADITPPLAPPRDERGTLAAQYGAERPAAHMPDMPPAPAPAPSPVSDDEAYTVTAVTVSGDEGGNEGVYNPPPLPSDNADSEAWQVAQNEAGRIADMEPAHLYIKRPEYTDLSILIGALVLIAERRGDGESLQFLDDMERINARMLERRIGDGMEQDTLKAYLGGGEELVALMLAYMRTSLAQYTAYVLAEYERIAGKV